MAKIRILYQSFGQAEGMNAYRTVLNELVQRAAGADTEIVLGGLRTALLEGKGFGAAQALDVPLLLENVGREVAGGIDAVAIGNGFDPGLWEARELFDVPVVGWLETMLTYCMKVGWKVGVLCSGAAGPPRIEELITRYGVASRCLRPVALGKQMGNMLPAFEDPAVLAEVRSAADAACGQLADQGAEVVFVASGLLDTILEWEQPDTLGGIPFVPGIPVLVKEAEAAARIAQAGVPYVSRVGRFRAPPQSVIEAVAHPDRIGR